jgi:hypothetical protein
MRSHQTFLPVPAKRVIPSDLPVSRPVRPPRVLATLARTPGRFRGSARRALRPFCEELAGLGLAQASSQEARPGTGEAGRQACHSQMPRWSAERRARLTPGARPPERAGHQGAPLGAPPPSPFRCGGSPQKTRKKRNCSAGTGQDCLQTRQGNGFAQDSKDQIQISSTIR